MKRREDPFVGITFEVIIPKLRPPPYDLLCDPRYPEAIRRAGGYPVMLPLARRKATVRKYLDGIDGLIVVGGADVHPALYGERRREGTHPVHPDRQRSERMLYAEARRRGMPIFGICYGMQMINVLEGGTLYQDIQRDAGSTRDHRNRKHPHTQVRILPDSRLRRILGTDRIPIHCDHHQAVRNVPPGFRPVAFAPDGIIEAIEGESEDLLAVQWHPERMVRSATARRLFRHFVRRCAT